MMFNVSKRANEQNDVREIELTKMRKWDDMFNMIILTARLVDYSSEVVLHLSSVFILQQSLIGLLSDCADSSCQ